MSVLPYIKRISSLLYIVSVEIITFQLVYPTYVVLLYCPSGKVRIF